VNPRFVSLLVGIAGGALVPLAFLPWLTIWGRHRPVHYTETISGNQIEGLSGFGDGYIVAALGAMAALAAALIFLVPRSRRLIAPFLALTAVLISGVAANDILLAKRGSKYFPVFTPGSEVFDVDAGIALWATLVLGIAITLGSILLFASEAPRRAVIYMNRQLPPETREADRRDGPRGIIPRESPL
jgi:hypothetical protein